MGSSIVAVVKVVAPIALTALAEAAARLLSQTNTNLAVAGYSTPISTDPESDGEIILEDTTSYIDNQFALNYGYFYKGLTSSPPYAAKPIIGASQEIIVWDPKKNVTGDIQKYISSVLQGSISDADAIFLSNNLATLFLARFKQADLVWRPFNKRYNLDDGLIVDLQMVTAGGQDPDNNLLGLATYCFVVYKYDKK